MADVRVRLPLGAFVSLRSLFRYPIKVIDLPVKQGMEVRVLLPKYFNLEREGRGASDVEKRMVRWCPC